MLVHNQEKLNSKTIGELVMYLLYTPCTYIVRGHLVNTVTLTPICDFPQRKFERLTCRTKTNMYQANKKGKTKSTEPSSQGDDAPCTCLHSWLGGVVSSKETFLSDRNGRAPISAISGSQSAATVAALAANAAVCRGRQKEGMMDRRLNGFLRQSLNDRTIQFLVMLLDKTVSVG